MCAVSGIYRTAQRQIRRIRIFLQIIAPVQSRLLRGPVLPSIKTDNRQRPTPDSVFFIAFFLFAIDNGIIAFTP